MKPIYLTALLSFFVWNTLYAADPIGACRVKEDMPSALWKKTNNAGCVITKTENHKTKFLLVAVDKAGGDRGWGFPGGGNASKAKDAKIDKVTGKPKHKATAKIASSVDFDYTEPAPCTASREAREEIGQEVIVGDLLAEEKHFLAFECFLTGLEAELDKEEIKGMGWFGVEEMKREGFLRFKSNAAIAEAYLKNK